MPAEELQRAEGSPRLLGLYRPGSTRRVRLLELYSTVKCSLLLMWVPFTVEKVPLRELQVRISKVLLKGGTNPLRSPIFSVPPSVAVRVTLS